MVLIYLWWDETCCNSPSSFQQQPTTDLNKDSQLPLSSYVCECVQVQLLQKQLHGIQLDRALGTQLMLSSEHPYHTVLLRDLKAQLEALKTQREETLRQATDQQPTYEIYARTEAAKFAHLSKVSKRK